MPRVASPAGSHPPAETDPSGLSDTPPASPSENTFPTGSCLLRETLDFGLWTLDFLNVHHFPWKWFPVDFLERQRHFDAHWPAAVSGDLGLVRSQSRRQSPQLARQVKQASNPFQRSAPLR